MTRKETSIKIISAIIVGLIIITCIKLLNEKPFYCEIFINIIENDEEHNLKLHELQNYKKEINNEISYIKNENLLKKCYYSLSRISFLENNHEEYNKYLEKSKEFIGDKYDKVDIMIYDSLSKIHIRNGNLIESEKYFNKAKEISKSKNMNSILWNLYFSRAKSILTSKGNIEEVILLLEESKKISQNHIQEVKSSLFLSRAYKMLGRISLSLVNSKEALFLGIENKDNKAINASIIDLGENFYMEGYYTTVIDIYEDLLKSNRVENIENKMMIYGYLVTCYADIGYYNESEKYKNKYLSLVKNITNEDRYKELAWIYIEYSNVNLNRNELHNAKKYYYEAKKILEMNQYSFYEDSYLRIKLLDLNIRTKENYEYKEILNEYELLMNEIDEQNIKTDLMLAVIDSILKLSYFNEDYYTYSKYSNRKINHMKESKLYYDTEKSFENIQKELIEKETEKNQNKQIYFLNIIIIMLTIITNIFYKYNKIKNINYKLKQATITDSLTGTYNKSYLNEKLLEFSKYKKKITFIMIDIDYFKLYNDNYGHLKGDYALRDIGNIIKEVFNTDYTFRYGGEEFSVISDRKKDDIIEDIECLRETIKKYNIVHKYSKVSDRITVSIGCKTSNISSQCEINNIIVAADKNLYKSKENGRNRYTF